MSAVSSGPGVIGAYFGYTEYSYFLHQGGSFSKETMENIQAMTHLLLEIPPILLINQHQVQIISRAEPLVHIPERRRQVEAAQEQPDRYRLSSYRRTVHDLELRDRLALVVLVRW